MVQTGDIRHRHQIIALNAVTAVIGMSLDLNTTLDTALLVTMDLIGAQASSISLMTEDTDELILMAQRSWAQDDIIKESMIRPLATHVFFEDKPVFHNSIDEHESFALPTYIKSIAMAPMHAHGKIIGILTIMSKNSDRFDHELVGVLEAIADTIGIAIDNAYLYAKTVEHEHRLAAVIESTADGIITTTNTSKISLINHAAESMLGVHRDELIGVPLREAPIPAHTKDLLLLALSTRQHGEEKTFKVNVENGQFIAVLVSPIHYLDPTGQFEENDGWVIVLQNISHQREEQIARAEFIRMAAHDMRNPLGVTYGSLVMLNKITDEEETRKKDVIQMALGGVDRIKMLIDNLLALEQIESLHNFHKEDINLQDLAHEILMIASNYTGESSRKFLHFIPKDLPIVNVDVRWLKKAIEHLVHNAYIHTPDDSEITLLMYSRGNHIHIEIRDNGPPIPTSIRPHLYERFYRSKNTETEGTGLGLAIVQSIAEAHDGTAYVFGDDVSNTFGVKLPID